MRFVFDRKRWGPLIILSLLAGALSAETLVLPVEAIADSGRLSAAEFAERHPGIDLAGGVPEVEGYFIRYRHENLVYLFGPVVDRTEAQRWRLELEVIRDRAIESRPALRTSTVDLFEFRWDAVAAKPGESVAGESAADTQPADRPAPSPESGAGTPPSGSPAPPPPGSPAPPNDATPGPPAPPAPPSQPESGLWALIRRIFGGR